MGNEENDIRLQIKSAHLNGIESGLVNKLPGFDKKRHKLPTEANEYTNAFLAKIAEEDLAQLTETFFQSIKSSLAYKRKDISVTTQSPCTLFETKDFSFEIIFSLDPETPAHYLTNLRLYNITNHVLLTQPEFNQVFEHHFDAVVFRFSFTLPIETIIDAIEEDETNTFAVDYPSNCSECTIHFKHKSATIRCFGTEMTVQFDSKQPPATLYDSFQELNDAFSDIEPFAEIFVNG